jgi:Spy/CpxP family protein refolding chaperone
MGKTLLTSEWLNGFRALFALFFYPQRSQIMSTIRRILVSLVAAASITLGMGAALGAPHSGPFSPHHAREFSPENLKRHFETRQSRLHEALKLTEKQEAAWKSYVQKITPKAEGVEEGKRFDREAFQKLSTPERLEKLLEFARKRDEFLSARLAVVKSFYAELTPEQKKTYDEFHFPTRKGKAKSRHERRGRRH